MGGRGKGERISAIPNAGNEPWEKPGCGGRAVLCVLHTGFQSGFPQHRLELFFEILEVVGRERVVNDFLNDG